MSPDVMVGEGSGCERRSLNTGADGERRVHAPPIPEREGLRPHPHSPLLQPFGHAFERPQHDHVLLESPNEPGIPHKRLHPGILLDPSGNFVGSLSHER